MTKPKIEVMENSGINFEESMEDVLVEDQPSDFNPQAFSTPGPKGDDDDEEDEEDNGNNEGGDEEEPAIDPDIVHSPVPPQPGPGPKVI